MRNKLTKFVQSVRQAAFNVVFRAFWFCFEDLLWARLESTIGKVVAERTKDGVMRKSSEQGLITCFCCPRRFGLKKDVDKYACELHYTRLVSMHQEQDRLRRKAASSPAGRQ